MKKSKDFIIFFILILVISNLYICSRNNVEFNGVIVDAKCIVYGKSDIGLQLLVNNGDFYRKFALPPKDKLCKDYVEDKINYIGKEVTVKYSHFYGYFQKTMIFYIEGYGDIEPNWVKE